MSRTASITVKTGALLLLALFLLLLVPTISQAAPTTIRATVVKRTASAITVKSSSPYLRKTIKKSQKSIRLYSSEYRVAVRKANYVLLTRVRKPKRPVTPQPTATPTPSATPTPTATPTPSATPTPTATPTPSATPTPDAPVAPKVSANQLVMTSAEIDLLRRRIAAGEEPYTAAWIYFRDGRVRVAMNDSPDVDPGPTITYEYEKLDTDSRYARNLAIAYASTGDKAYAAKSAQYLIAWAQGHTPAPFSFTKDRSAGYHQSYGAFSFAWCYDLTRDAGVYSDEQKATIETWFRTWSSVMKSYQDDLANDYWMTHSGRGTYGWPGSELTYDRTDYYTGCDHAASPAVAWLACAIVTADTTQINTLFSSSYRLSVPRILHSSTNPDNDGDGKTTAKVPQVLIFTSGYYDNASRGGTLDYMTYNARLSSILYQMTAHLGRATQTQHNELKASWNYLSQFAGPDQIASPAPNDLIHWDLHLARTQSAVHIFGDQQFLADVTNGEYSQAQFYEGQMLGPTTLTQM